jgi:hypothetical protein
LLAALLAAVCFLYQKWEISEWQFARLRRPSYACVQVCFAGLKHNHGWLCFGHRISGAIAQFLVSKRTIYLSIYIFCAGICRTGFKASPTTVCLRNWRPLNPLLAMYFV